MRKILFFTWLFIAPLAITAQDQNNFTSDLQMEEIMQGEDWIGVSPSNLRWSLDSKTLYFQWQQENDTTKEWYAVAPGKTNLRKASIDEQKKMQVSNLSYTQNKQWAVFERQGDIYLWDFRKKKERQITDTPERESYPRFIKKDTEIAFQRGENLYSLSLKEEIGRAHV